MKKYLLISVLSCAALYTHAQELRPVLNYKTAGSIIKGCIEYAESNKVTMAIAVYDASGILVSFAKMDGSSVAAGNVAQWKGLAAATYWYPTSEMREWNVPTAPDMATAAGGLPIKVKDGTAIGGVGVSGAASSVDVLCAQAGLKMAGLYIEGESRK